MKAALPFSVSDQRAFGLFHPNELGSHIMFEKDETA
jgi:hypothetical protein